MRVVVAGATGVIGRRTVPELIAAGHDVTALARDGGARHELLETGVRLVRGDLLDPESLRRAVRGADVVVNVASAIPTNPQPTPADWAVNDRVRGPGTRNLLEAARAAGVAHYVHTSVYLVYGDEPPDDPVDESAPLRPAPRIRSAVEGELATRACGLAWTILRPGWLYDARAASTVALIRQLRDGEAVVVDGTPAWRSPIHAVDVARAIGLVVEHRPDGGIFNVADRQPVRAADLLDGIADLLGAPRPARISAADAASRFGPGAAVLRRSARLATTRLRSAVGFEPRFATWRAGFEEVLQQLD